MDQNFPAYRGSPFIETPLIEVALYIYTGLIEETGRPPRLILACGDIFGLARTSSSFGKNFTHLTSCDVIFTFLKVQKLTKYLYHTPHKR